MSEAIAERSARTSVFPLARRALPTSLLVGLLCLFLATYVVRILPETNGDGRLALTYAIVDEGRLAIDTYVAEQPRLLVDAALREGHYYTAKPPLPSLLLAPVYAVLRAGGPPASINDPAWRWQMTLALSGTSFVAITLLLWHLQRRLGLRMAGSPIAALAAATGTPLVVYASFGSSHMLAAAMLLAVVYCALRAPRHGAICGALIGALIATETLVAVAAVIPFGRLLWVRARGLGLGALVVPLACAAAAALALPWYLAAAFGSPTADMYAYLVTPEFRVGYLAGAMALPRPDVLGALLFSPNRGLFVFAPIVIIGVWRMAWLWRHDPASRLAVALSGAAAVTLIVGVSGYVFWYGGASYGPRYLVPVLPLLSWSLASVPPRAVALIGLFASLPQLFVLTVHDPLLELAHVFPYGDYIARGNSPTLFGLGLGPAAIASVGPIVLMAAVFLLGGRQAARATA